MLGDAGSGLWCCWLLAAACYHAGAAGSMAAAARCRRPGPASTQACAPLPPRRPRRHPRRDGEFAFAFITGQTVLQVRRRRGAAAGLTCRAPPASCKCAAQPPQLAAHTAPNPCHTPSLNRRRRGSRCSTAATCPPTTSMWATSSCWATPTSSATTSRVGAAAAAAAAAGLLLLCFFCKGGLAWGLVWPAVAARGVAPGRPHVDSPAPL